MVELAARDVRRVRHRRRHHRRRRWLDRLVAPGARRARIARPASPDRDARGEPGLRRRAALRLRGRHARVGLLHRRRRAVRSRRARAAASRPRVDTVDVVQGYKIRRADNVARRVIGRVYHRFVAFTFGLEIRDTDCDFRLIRKSALDRITLDALDRCHLCRAGREAAGLGRAVRGGADPSLPARARAFAVLPLLERRAFPPRPRRALVQ